MVVALGVIADVGGDLLRPFEEAVAAHDVDVVETQVVSLAIEVDAELGLLQLSRVVRRVRGGAVESDLFSAEDDEVDGGVQGSGREGVHDLERAHGAGGVVGGGAAGGHRIIVPADIEATRARGIAGRQRGDDVVPGDVGDRRLDIEAHARDTVPHQRRGIGKADRHHRQPPRQGGGGPDDVVPGQRLLRHREDEAGSPAIQQVFGGRDAAV